ncbi:helix-turn-helix transcriptional regulator [Sulfitobacter sp. M22298]|uniref:helix-turn-helix transcriptional regulator n=1 Tax=Sulfitobacter sp. M22298 TaxID=3368575 RepID=UPI003746C1A4
MKLLSKKEVCVRTSYSRAHVDRLANDPEYRHIGFPKPVRLGQARVAFVEEELTAWIKAQIAKRDSST